jgi:hypothetical protein
MIIMTLAAGMFSSCEQLEQDLQQSQSEEIKIVSGITAVTDLTHKWDTTSNSSHPTDEMTARLQILETKDGKVVSTLLDRTVEPYFEAWGKLSKQDYNITPAQLNIRPTSKKINRHTEDDGSNVTFEVDTVRFYFEDGQELYIPLNISQYLEAVGSRDYKYGTLTLKDAEFVGLTNEEVATKADVIVNRYNTTYKAVLKMSETNLENPKVFDVPVEVSTGRNIVSNNDVEKVEVLNKRREGLTTTTERVAFDKVTTYKNGETTTQTIEKILSHLFWGIDPYNKKVTSFGYTLNGRNGISEGTETKDTEETEGNWNVWQRTDKYSSNLSNGVQAEKIVTDYSLMHKRAIYKDADVEVVFGYEDITVSETANDTKVTEVTSDRSGYRKANLLNNIGTNYLQIEQPLNETVYLYMVDKGVKNHDIQNAKLTVYKDSVVAVLDWITNFNDGTKETVKEHINKPRTLAPISDWQSIQKKAEQNTAKEVSVETDSQTKTEGYWKYVQEVRSLKNVTTLPDNTTKTNAWVCETPNKFVYEREGLKKEFEQISFAVEQVEATLTDSGKTEGAYKLYDFTDEIKVVFGSDIQNSTAPGLIKFSAEVEKYDYKDKKLVVTDNDVTASVIFITVFSDGKTTEEEVKESFPRTLTVKSNWQASEYNANVSTGSATVTVMSRDKKTKGDFTYYEEVRDIKTKATLNNSVQTNQWESVDPNRIVMNKNGVSVDFGTIAYEATENGQKVNKVDDKNYNYTDEIKVVFGENTKTATAPGKIVIATATVTGYSISNPKMTVSQDKVNTSLTFTTNFSDGTSTEENISKDFPRSFRQISNWTSEEKDNSQSTGSASVNLKSSSSKTDGDFSYSQETRQITTKATLKGSTQTNEWESVDPNKIVFSRNGKSHDFGTISFSATEKGASTSLANETATSATYNYTDNLSVTYGDNTFSSTAPGKINVAKPKTVTSRETSNEKLTVSRDKVNASLTFTTTYSDGTSDSENISKDFPRSFKTLSNWTSSEEDNSQSTGSASVSLKSSNNQTDGNFSYVKETRTIKTVATLKGSTQTNEWESVEPNKIVFSRDGVSYNFGEINFSANEQGASTTKKSDTEYSYSDKIGVTYGDNSFSATAPGTIKIKEKWIPDFPEEYGKFVKAVVTTTRDESRKTWMYIVSVQFEKKTLPLFIHKNDSKPSYNLKYAVAANSKYNCASYLKNQDTWVNSIASDGAECLDWATIDGKNADNLPYSTAVAWGWDNGHQKNGHPTVFTNTFTATVKDSVLTIKKGNTVFATYKSAK